MASARMGMYETYNIALQAALPYSYRYYILRQAVVKRSDVDSPISFAHYRYRDAESKPFRILRGSAMWLMDGE
jgi:hypothetical protein